MAHEQAKRLAVPDGTMGTANGAPRSPVPKCYGTCHVAGSRRQTRSIIAFERIASRPRAPTSPCSADRGEPILVGIWVVPLVVIEIAMLFVHLHSRV